MIKNHEENLLIYNKLLQEFGSMTDEEYNNIKAKINNNETLKTKVETLGNLEQKVEKYELLKTLEKEVKKYMRYEKNNIITEILVCL